MSNINIQLPPIIVKLFRKGRPDKLYRQMHQVARDLASSEMHEYQQVKLIELQHDLWVTGKSGSLDLNKHLWEYEKQRLDYHMEHMFRLLELIASAERRVADAGEKGPGQGPN